MGIDNWKDVTSRKHRRSKDDEVLKISKSVFVTNFPESIYACDLWKSCSVYGTVVDVFIPSKNPKQVKICVCSLHQVRFERPHKPNVSATNNSGAASRTEKPFNSQQTNNGVDDSCLIDRDMSNHVLGKVKELSSIPNLHTILKDEGFSDVKVSYIGGLWVLLKLTLMDTKLNLMNHIGVKSWFHTIQEEPDDEFMNDEDRVPETIFGSSSPVPNHRDEDKNAAYSDDPFGLYDLLKNKKGAIDKDMDRGIFDDDIVFRRFELKHKLHNVSEMESKDNFQKSKVKWAVERDENSKFFHGITNKRRAQLAIRGIFVDGFWQTDPGMIKDAFFNQFVSRFKEPANHIFKLNFKFNKKLHQNQMEDLERSVSRDEIRRAVWSCGDNKSPGPDGFTFEFFKKY
nr:RNA-directed DNA polymerase, eukaryota [Tanacetum cinerariifolium]